MTYVKVVDTLLIAWHTDARCCWLLDDTCIIKQTHTVHLGDSDLTQAERSSTRLFSHQLD